MYCYLHRYGLILALLFIQCVFLNTILSAQTTSAWNAPPDAALIKNPLTDIKAGANEGKKLYTSNCVACHGAKGKGDGPAAASLKPKPADHTSDAVQNETDGSLYWKISEGHTPMPQYKSALTEEQRWELVSYIRTLAKSTTKK